MISIPLGYVVRLLYANNLSISEFGLFYALLNFFGFISVFNDLGFSETLRYFIPRYVVKHEKRKIKSAVIAAFITKCTYTIIVGSLLYICAGFFSAQFFKVPEAAHAIRIMIIYWFLSGMMSVLCDIFFAYKEAAIYGSTEVVRMILTVCIVFISFSLYPADKFYIVIWGWIAVYAVMVLIYSLIFFKKHRKIFQAKKYPFLKIYREFTPYMIPTAIQSGILTLLNNSTVMLLTFLKGVEAVALYNIAQPIANILLLFIQPLSSLLLPVTIEFDVKKEHHKIRQILMVILNFGVFFLLPFTVLLCMYSYEIISLLFKSVYTQASFFLKLASFQIFFVILNNFILVVVSGFGLPKERAKVIGYATGINLLLSGILIYIWGVSGAFIAGLSTYIFMSSRWIGLIRSKLSFSIPWKNYGKIFVLILLFVAVSSLGSSYISIENIYIKICVVSSISLFVYFSLGIFVCNIVDISFLKRLMAQK